MRISWLIHTVDSKAYPREYDVVDVRWWMYSCYCTVDVQLLLYVGCTAVTVRRCTAVIVRWMYSCYCMADVQLLLYSGCTAVTVGRCTAFTVQWMYSCYCTADVQLLLYGGLLYANLLSKNLIL